MSLARILAVAVKEGREVLRDRIFFLLAFLMSPMLLLLFGYGMNQDVENVPFAILDQDKSALSRDYSHRFIGSRYFKFQGYLHSPEEGERLLRDGAVRAVILIPDKFQERLASGKPAEVMTLLDSTFTFTVRTMRGYFEAISSAASAEMQMTYAARRLGVPTVRSETLFQPVRIELRYLYNQELRGIWATAPMVMMVVLMWMTPLLMALSVVREKETGAIYNIYASTIRRTEFLIGKLLPNVVISGINGLLLWLISVYYFGAPFKGSLLVFAIATLLYVIANSCFGLLISLMVRTQQAALMASIILGSMVAMQYSGLNTPIADMTGANYVIAHLFPAMYYTAVVEATFLKEGGLAQVWGAMLSLAVCAAWMWGLALFRFHKRMRA